MASATPQRVTIEVTDGIADVRFNRADKLNALDTAQFEAIAAAIDQLAAMKGVRCVVLSGEGRGFCAGIDLENLAGNPAPNPLETRTHGIANIFQHVAWGLRELPMPVIAAVHGFALGGGFQIMLGADIRIAVPDTQFSIMEARWGICPDMGGIALLRGLVRDDVARELTYTARKFDGAEALQLGVVTRLANDPYLAAMAMAQTIAGQSPAAIRADKRLFNLALDGAANAEAILLAEAHEQTALLKSSGHRETIMAHLQKRKPVFNDD
jgi:enoyl-CoA hydratase/carnithine racemase